MRIPIIGPIANIPVCLFFSFQQRCGGINTIIQMSDVWFSGELVGLVFEVTPVWMQHLFDVIILNMYIYCVVPNDRKPYLRSETPFSASLRFELIVQCPVLIYHLHELF